MILRRLADAFRRQDWFVVVVELIVLVAGILIALQVDQWAQRREERVIERVYLERLADDLRIERARMDAALGYAAARMEAVRLLERLAGAPGLAPAEASRLAWAIETASWRSFPRITAFVYRELQSTGRMTLLRSMDLRRALAEHYAQIEHEARVGEDLGAQQRFEAATVGLLTVDELVAVENASGDPHAVTMAPERALAVSQAFAARPDAVAELASLAQHHTFNIRVIGDMQRRVEALVGRIDALLAEPER